MTIRKVKASLVKVEIDDYICETSYLFYDIDTGCIRIANGTPGGMPACIEGFAGALDWGDITGTITDQIDLIALIDTFNSDEDGFIKAFIGKDTSFAETPVYTSTNQVTQNNDLEGAIGELDLAIGIDLVGNTIITTGDPSNEAIQDLANYVETNNQVTNITNVTTITVVDSVLSDVAKWLVRIEEAATPANVYAAEMIAIHNGTDSDTSKYAIIELGSKIAGLDVTVTLTGGNTLNINVAATPAVNVTVKRIMVI